MEKFSIQTIPQHKSLICGSEKSHALWETPTRQDKSIERPVGPHGAFLVERRKRTPELRHDAQVNMQHHLLGPNGALGQSGLPALTRALIFLGQGNMRPTIQENGRPRLDQIRFDQARPERRRVDKSPVSVKAFDGNKLRTPRAKILKTAYELLWHGHQAGRQNTIPDEWMVALQHAVEKSKPR